MSRSKPYLILPGLIASVSFVILTGCATSLVRSGGDPPEHPFPATALDFTALVESGIQGKPPFPTADPDQRSGPLARTAWVAASLIDLPFSIALDTLLLPFDLTTSHAAKNEPQVNEGTPD